MRFYVGTRVGRRVWAGISLRPKDAILAAVGFGLVEALEARQQRRQEEARRARVAAQQEQLRAALSEGRPLSEFDRELVETRTRLGVCLVCGFRKNHEGHVRECLTR
jgi:hypothetical protein